MMTDILPASIASNVNVHVEYVGTCEEKPQRNKKIFKTPKSQINVHVEKNKKSSIISVNIRGLIPGLRRDKLIFLEALAEETNADFICLTETHLVPEVTPEEINIPGWQIIRSDRLLRQGGGALTLVRDDLTVTHEKTFSNTHVEVTLCYIPKLEIAIITLYRPPHAPVICSLRASIVSTSGLKKLNLISRGHQP